MAMRLTTRFLTAAALLAAFTLASAPATAENQQHGKPTRYSLTVLGTLGGDFSQTGGGLNNRGAVAGISALSRGNLHAFLWEDGVMTDLGTLGGPDSFTQESSGVNGRVMVVGYSETAKRDPNREDFCGLAAGRPTGRVRTCLPFVWQGGKITALPTLGGNNGFASAINSRGQIVGLAETSHPDPTCPPPLVLRLGAVLWQNGRARELPPLPGDHDAVANGINGKGEIVGASGTCGSLPVGAAPHALLWRHGKPVNLGNLGGTVGNYAFGINNRSQVVGTSSLPGNAPPHAFLWQNGKMTDLGALPGDVSSLANAINNRGQVVGFSTDSNGNNTAVLWQHGAMTNLNTLIPPDSRFFLLEALGINNRGQIIGYGSLPNGQTRGYLLTPRGTTGG